MIHFDLAQVISLSIGVVLPLLVGLVTRWDTHPRVQALLLLGASAVSAFLSGWLDAINGGHPFDVGATLLAVLGTFLTGVGAHFGFWRPTGVAAVALRAFTGPPSVPPPAPAGPVAGPPAAA